MSEEIPSPKKFILFTLLLLPSFFFAWYTNAHFVAQTSAWSLNQVLPDVFPKVVYKIAPADKHLVLLSLVKPNQTQVDRPTESGQAIEMNLLARSFSLPMFIALAVASEATIVAHVLRILAGLLISYAFVLLSVVAKVLYLLQFDIRFAHIDPVTENLLAGQLILNGYYLSSVVFPALIPIVVWAAFYPATFKALVPVDKLIRKMDSRRKSNP